MRTLSSFACAAASPRSWKFRKILYSAVALHTQFPLCGMFQKQPICYTEQFRIKKGKFSFSFFVCWDAEGLRNILPDVTHRKRQFSFDGGFPAAIYVSRWKMPNKRVGEITPQPCTVNSSSFGEHFFSYLLCLTQHLFLVGHGCNLRGVLSREIKSVISTGKQAFW